jgi:hypothetical protein
VTIKSVVVDDEIKSEPDVAESIDEVIAANPGRRVALLLTDGRTVEGEIVAGRSNATLTLRNGGGERVLLRSLIKEIVSETPLNRARKREAIVRSLRIGVEATKPGKIVIRSLERGLGWVPSYEAILVDDRTLRLTGRATLANDLADLTAVNAELVTGTPNVRFAGTLDPLISGRGGGGIDFISYDPTDNSLVLDELKASPSNRPAPIPMPAVGQGLGTLQELFRHRLPPLTLRQGARAQVTLFDVQGTYREVFTWDVEMADDPQAFWRTIRFPNVSGRPLASGQSARSGTSSFSVRTFSARHRSRKRPSFG